MHNVGKSNRAIATFTSKGHDLFATVHGSVSLDCDRATIDRLWKRFVAAGSNRSISTAVVPSYSVRAMRRLNARR